MPKKCPIHPLESGCRTVGHRATRLASLLRRAPLLCCATASTGLAQPQTRSRCFGSRLRLTPNRAIHPATLGWLRAPSKARCSGWSCSAGADGPDVARRIHSEGPPSPSALLPSLAGSGTNCRAVGLPAMRPLAVARFRRNAAGLTPIRRLSGRSLARSKRWWAQCLSIRPGVRQWEFAWRPTSLARGTTLEPRLTRQLMGQ